MSTPPERSVSDRNLTKGDVVTIHWRGKGQRRYLVTAASPTPGVSDDHRSSTAVTYDLLPDPEDE